MTWAWRTDAYSISGGAAFCNYNDGSDTNGAGGATEYAGIHPSVLVGIPYLVKNLVLPKLPPRPYVTANPATQQAAISQAFSFAVPAGSLTDTLGQTLTYSATLVDGSALPSWLSVNSGNGTLSGTPLWQNRAMLSVRLIATNTAGRSAFLLVPIWVDSELAFISEAYVRSDNLSQLAVDGSNLVSKWADASNHGLSFVQSNATYQPKYVASVVDGHGAVRGRWDGTNASQLQRNDNPILKYGAFATFTVFRRWADLGAIEAFAGKWTSGSREIYAAITAADKAAGYVTATASSGPTALPTGATTLALNTTYVIETGWDGTNAYVRLNGGTPITVAQSAVYNGAAAYYLFSLDTTKFQPTVVDMFEHGFVPGGVSSAQRTAILARVAAEFPSYTGLSAT